MRGLVASLLFVLLLGAAALWVDTLAERLPDVVAVHFNAQGAGNGFMTRAGCRKFMMLFTVGAPAFIACVTALLPRFLPASMLNIPHRDYWMAPARAAQSIAFLSEQGIWFSCVFLVFLAVVDWMLVKANGQVPPAFPTTPFLAVLVLFFCAVGIWAQRMFKRFGRPV
jgi:hypothetical protein